MKIGSKAKAIVSRLVASVSEHYLRYLQLAGLSVFLLARFSLISIPALERSIPVEPDDVYAYMVRGSRLKNCSFDNCRALEDLRDQLLHPTSDPAKQWQRYLVYFRTLLFPYPLHSVLLALLNQIGLSWEVAYQLLAFVSVFFIGIAANRWLASTWGRGPAGIALLLLAPYVSITEGLHSGSPEAPALGLAMLSWSAIMSKRENPKWLYLVSSALMVGFHPTGRVYAAATMMLLLAISYRDRRAWITALMIGVMLIVVSLMPTVLDAPELGFGIDLEPKPEGWTFWEGVHTNIETSSTRSIQVWLFSFWSPLFIGLILLVGFITVRENNRKKVLLMGGVLLALLITSLFFVRPAYPGVLFERLWTPTVIYLSGAIGQAILVVSKSWLSLVGGLLSRSSDKSYFAGLLLKPPWGLAVLLLTSLALALGMITNIQHDLRHYPLTLQSGIDGQNYELDPEQPAHLKSLARNGDTVLYGNMVMMHHYLLYGGEDLGAVYYPAIVGSPEEILWIRENKDIRFIVSRNALGGSTISKQGGLILSSNEKIIVNSDLGFPLEYLQFWIANPKIPTTLHLKIYPGRQSQPHDISIDLSADSSGWHSVSNSNEKISAVELKLNDNNAQVSIKGIKTASHQSYNWPWDKGITVLHSSENADQTEVVVHFDTEGLYPFLDHPVRIISDRGSSLLAEIYYEQDSSPR